MAIKVEKPFGHVAVLDICFLQTLGFETRQITPNSSMEDFPFFSLQGFAVEFRNAIGKDNYGVKDFPSVPPQGGAVEIRCDRQNPTLVWRISTFNWLKGCAVKFETQKVTTQLWHNGFPFSFSYKAALLRFER